MKKRGMANMWWIIAAIILVLVVVGSLLYIFSIQIGGFQETSESCLLKGGTCKGSCNIGEQEVEADCSNEIPCCCVGV